MGVCLLKNNTLLFHRKEINCCRWRSLYFSKKQAREQGQEDVEEISQNTLDIIIETEEKGTRLNWSKVVEEFLTWK